MSYQVLARKWRPRTFADMVGQVHVLQALANALESGRLHHAYLFAGTRGVGKTTVARILAKALNCAAGVGANPCGKCTACTEIDEGRFVDLIEVDAASRTRVDDTREILDNVQYAPAHGRFKVYLIDEVHMLSTHSFNALLKTLEEPPPHVKFLLATTDPQKLPVTVLSRCLQFNLKRLPTALIQERMAEICESEAVPAEPAALALVARAAAGSMRDALSLLDQAIAYGAGTVSESDTRAILGTVERRELERLLTALASGDASGLMAIVASIDEQFPDYARLLDELSAKLQRTAVFQVTGGIDSSDDDESALVGALAGQISAEDLQLYYQTALIGKRDLNLAPDARSGFEMTLLRMIAFRPAGSTSERKGQGQTRPVASQGRASAVEKAARKPSRAQARSRPQVAEDPEQTGGNIDIPSSPEWHRLVNELGLTGFELLLAGNCSWERVEGNRVFLALDERSRSLLTDSRSRALEAAMARRFGAALSLQITVGTGNETPAQRDGRLADESVLAARKAIDDDPNVKTLKSIFDAEVESDSIRPVDPA